ncbi:hypothetical protein [Mycolicibacterium llatzerense]|uniref:hypothetical protein n=1 Tax=Mycolicibacterium llatzerense TaxID=280871 RepID=UPI0021B5DEFC|nr:hypothetical protein [Mycolicibacterium llatzerense]MCT7373210.1 hypothetical protein [Mycolicibacterium llatzerense]
MSRSHNDEPPCEHWDDLIGTVEAGDIHDRKSAHCSVATCLACVVKSQGYVQMRTGHPAKQLLTYEDARKGMKPHV